MIGRTVIVRTEQETGRDPLNKPIVETVDEEVENVLVTPGPRTDVVESNRPAGVEVVFNLMFPKTFAGSLRGAQIGIDGEFFAVIGDPRPFPIENTPTEWWMPAEVTRTDG